MKRTTCSYPRGLPLGKTKRKKDQIKNLAVIRNRMRIIVATSSEPKSGFSLHRQDDHRMPRGEEPQSADICSAKLKHLETDTASCIHMHALKHRPGSTIKVETKTTNLGFVASLESLRKPLENAHEIQESAVTICYACTGSLLTGMTTAKRQGKARNGDNDHPG